LISALEDIAGKYEATPAQVALNWIINFHGEAIVAIPGASKLRQARDNAGAMEFVLSQDDMTQLDELSKGYR
jgi:aryl-alcohol dehydrogenase-like predicted oxidoreductase